ncbi:MAG: Oligosaccharide 4-alpha-D-glucosyltransferase [Candidatus Ordinivivax streblomastigis]|uniref:Oligosaccharide 4-alpha-D-glucosyltransferase n=1 Tax=Candidatus Ordinivivax streblomastigis TaxID=2540710 RepID=A0A5M8P3S5_9BACT|nr:MAG: Oligosaccharide 4-alpha-D-glucosyltransferase [Candidatus Ordinivivax streblomastigis]
MEAKKGMVMKNRMRTIALCGIFILSALQATAQDASLAKLPLADPFVLCYNNKYYAYGTSDANGIVVYTSDDLKYWIKAPNLALHKNDSYADRWFWAPEVYYINGRFYMYYSADEHICVATSDSPLGPFKQDVKQPMFAEKGIDNSLFIDDDGKAYLFFVRFTDGNAIWVAELENDLKTLKTNTLHFCLSASQSWENDMGRVNEGPYVIKHEGTYYLTYSANDYQSQNYGVGYARAGTIMGDWMKYSNNPILQRPNGLVGSGHHCLFRDKEGRLRMAFHAHKSLTVVNPRETYITSVEFALSGRTTILTASPDYQPTYIVDSQFVKDSPVAKSSAVVTSGNMRFSVLTPELIRIERSEQNRFEDRASFVVLNRNLPVPAYTTREENGYLYITTDKLALQYKIGTHPVNTDPCAPNLQITLQVNDEDVVWYPGKKDPYNLKGTARTLDNAEGDVRSWLEDGLLSRSGWAVIDEKQPRNDGSLSLMFDGSEGVDWVAQRADPQSLDWYFLGYGHNYKKALSDFTTIAGKIPLPPLYAFGYWYSKYQRYSEQDFRNIVSEIKTNNIPIDVMVIDMDWHLNGKTGSTDNTEWTGWTWNSALFPNPANFIDWLHSQNLKTTLNLHPADGISSYEANYQSLAQDLGVTGNQTIDWNIENKAFYQAFFNRILRPHEDIGVNFWWLDWQQWMIARHEPNLGNTFWLNHVFFSDKKRQQTGRPLIFHRWGGLGNHRYQIGFSGDSHATFPSLAFQPYFTATASNVGYGYWSHDIGGHQQSGANDPELYLRWIQSGVFSPILRTHATNASNIERRIWLYPNFSSMLKAIELRYALIPYIYTYARYAYDTGISLCRPMYYEYPEREEAYRYEGQYMFGNDLLVAPIAQSDKGSGSVAKTIWLPEGKWYEAATGELLEGNQVVTRDFTREQIPYYYREGAIIPLYPPLIHLKSRPNTLILQFTPGDSSDFSYYEDEEDNDKYETAYTFTKITQSKEGAVSTYTIHPRQGSFTRMPSQRAYRLELLAKSQPSSVAFSNGTQGSYQYDSETKTITVDLPAQSCNAALTVKVTE